MCLIRNIYRHRSNIQTVHWEWLRKTETEPVRNSVQASSMCGPDDLQQCLIIESYLFRETKLTLLH